MSGFDIVIGLIFVISIVVGIMRGLIKEALSVTSWIMAIWLASTFSAQAGDLFSQYVSIPNATFRSWIGFTLVFVLTLFVFAIISWAVSKVLVRGPIKGTDRVLGIFFGAARAGLIVVALLILGRGLGMNDSAWWQQSRYLPMFLPAADYIEPMVFKQLPDASDSEATMQQKLLEETVQGLNQTGEILQELRASPNAENDAATQTAEEDN